MTILVTGGAGYIGSFATRRLIELGHEVIVYDNLTTGFADAVPSACQLVREDIRDTTALKNVFSQYKIDSVLHFAAKVVVPESVANPDLYFENNFVGSTNLMKAALDAGVKKVIFSSTAAVYAPTNEMLIPETAETGPINPYGETKRETEKLLFELNQSEGLNFIALRYFNVAGACLKNKLGQRTKNATHLIKVASEAAVGKRKLIEVFGTDYPTPDGSAVRDYIHVEDLVEAHILALDHLQNYSIADVFNCGYGHGSSVLEVLKTMEKVSGVKIEKRLVDRRPGDAPQTVANSSKIKKVLSWRPKYDNLETICRTAYLWEKSLG